MNRHTTADNQYPHMTRAAGDCFRRAVEVTELLNREVVTTSALLYGVMTDLDVAALFERIWPGSVQTLLDRSLAHVKSGLPTPPQQTSLLFSAEVENLIVQRTPLGVGDLVFILATKSHFNSHPILRANLPGFDNIDWKEVVRDLRPAENRVRVLTRRVR
jgi:hypothetical protein